MTFTKLESRELIDIQSQGHLYQHDQSGAQVLYIQNDDPNKAFTIAFRTPPYNDNGIAHIIEHSVLNGSTKYPSKEPFVELIKGSMNTFINAMTFSDKTVYPVASTNDQDFKNLMAVYLDAVFAPNFRQNSQILAQEGWHLHLEKAEDDLIYKGVVYNEMKGAMAAPEPQLFDQLNQGLYPDSIYAHESGGLPSAIPSLTQEEFVSFHNQYYQPGNSLTVLYGDLDLEEAFDQLGEYFDGHDPLTEPVDLTVDLKLPSQERIEASYSIASEDDPSVKDFLALSWHVAQAEDVFELAGLEVLEEVLLGNQESPLRKAILDAGLAGDVYGGVDRVGSVQAFAVVAKYSSTQKLQAFQDLIQETLTRLVQEGIDKDLIQASINKIAFNLKESVISESQPRGVLYALTALETWLYGGSPFAAFEFSALLEELKDKAQNGYFEHLIQEKLLDNPHRVLVSLKAEPGKNDREEARVHQELQAYKKNLTAEGIQSLLETTQALITRQEAPDQPADLAKIPMLKQEDLQVQVEDLNLSVEDLDHAGSLYSSDQFTSGIDYLDLWLDISDFQAEDYCDLSLLAYLIGNVATKNSTAAQLKQKMDLHTGGISAKLRIFADDHYEVKPFFALSGRALEDKSEELIDLMHEILMESQLDDPKQVSVLIMAQISQFQNRINYMAHQLAQSRALSQWRAHVKLQEYANGIDYYDYLQAQWQKVQDGQASEVLDRLDQVRQKLLNKKRLNIIYIGDSTRKQVLSDQVLAKFSDLPDQVIGDPVDYQPGPKQDEAFITAQDVNYVAMGMDTRDKLDFQARTAILMNELLYGYLWNTIRVKGGAYGAGGQHTRQNLLSFNSYRDPNIRRTIQSFQAIPQVVAQLNLDQQAFLKDVIGTLSPLERPKSAVDRGLLSLALHLTGSSPEKLTQLKQAIIDSQVEDLKPLSQSLASLLEEASLVVIGNKGQIEAEGELFDHIRDLY